MIIIVSSPTCCVYSFSLQMCFHVSLIGLLHYNVMFCITPAELCDTAPLYQGQVSTGGWWVPGLSEAFPGIPRRSYRCLYDIPVPFLLLRLSGRSHTHRRVHVQLCKLQVPLCSSTAVIVAGSSLHSWGRVCRHNSGDESSLETDTVNFRSVVALERVVACCTYECSY